MTKIGMCLNHDQWVGACGRMHGTRKEQHANRNDDCQARYPSCIAQVLNANNANQAAQYVPAPNGSWLSGWCCG